MAEVLTVLALAAGVTLFFFVRRAGRCPFCKERIKYSATVCPHCTREVKRG